MDHAYLAYSSDADGRRLSTLEDKKYPLDDEKEPESQKKLETVQVPYLTFRQSLSPVVAAFLFFAVDIRPKESDSFKRGFFVSFVLPALHLLVYAATCALFYCTIYSDDTNVRNFSANMAQGLCVTAFFITHLFFYFRRKRISTLIDDITQALIPSSSDEEPPPESILISTRWLAIFLVPMPFLLLILAFCCYHIAHVAQDTFFALSPRNVTVDNNSSLSDSVFWIFLFFFGVIFCYFVYAIGLFCIIIRTLTLVVERIKCPGVMTGSVSVALADVATFLRLHEVACRLVVKTDGSFKEVACVWCTVEMTCAVLFGRSANVNFKDTPEFDFVLAFIVIILLFVYKVLATASVNDSVITSLKEISYVDENTLQDLSPRSAALATKIKLYIQHVMVSSPTITGWGLFTIDKAVVLSAAGSILTYILVLYDK